jgi:hypothetical protein
MTEDRKLNGVSRVEFYQMMTIIWVFIGLLGSKQAAGQVSQSADLLNHILPTSAIVMALISGMCGIRARMRP